MATRTRVGVISEIPTPYRLPLYEQLANRDDLELEVLFCAAHEPDRPWQLDSALARVPHRVLRGWSPTVRTRSETFVYEVNPEIIPILRTARYDALVIGGYGVFAEQAAIAWAKATRTPYLLHSESHHLKARRRFVRTAKRALLTSVVGRAAAGLAVGTLAADYLESYGLQRGRIRIVPNTIDVAAFTDDAERARSRDSEVRARLGLPDRYALFVGRLVEGKGVRELLGALELLGASAPPLVVAGDGPLALEVNAAPGVTHLGFQPQERLIELYALATCTVIPSRAETWGVAVNEALACGCPVIVSDAVGAAYDLVRDGENGYVVPANDPQALADTLAKPRPPGNPAAGRIREWNYRFGADQFAEGVKIAVGG